MTDPDQLDKELGGGVDASTLGGDGRPTTGDGNRPGASGTARDDHNVTIPDPTGEENANSYNVEP